MKEKILIEITKHEWETIENALEENQRNLLSLIDSQRESYDDYDSVFGKIIAMSTIKKTAQEIIDTMEIQIKYRNLFEEEIE